jgi:hypothetical protein
MVTTVLRESHDYLRTSSLSGMYLATPYLRALAGCFKMEFDDGLSCNGCFAFSSLPGLWMLPFRIPPKRRIDQ